MFGTPCGGTTYMAKCLRKAGLLVAHEPESISEMARWPDGLVCGWWGIPVEHRGNRDALRVKASAHSFDVLGVLVRHPLNVAETLWSKLDGKRRFQWTTGEPVKDALRFWVEVHEAAGRQIAEAKRVHETIELRLDSNLEYDFGLLSAQLGVTVDPYAYAGRSKKNRLPPWTWEQWFIEDPAYAGRGARAVKRYGLDYEPEGIDE